MIDNALPLMIGDHIHGAFQTQSVIGSAYVLWRKFMTIAVYMGRGNKKMSQGSPKGLLSADQTKEIVGW